jgi:DNA-binding PadR family transcriptional regulator
MLGFHQFDPDRFAAGRHRGRRRHGMRWGGRGRHGQGDDGDDLRAGRMLSQGDLRLIILALIVDQARHGYEIIKLIEDKTENWYSPSPGIIYPTLTYLEEAGYATAQAQGAKKLYAITVEGRAHLVENRDMANAMLGRLAAVGARFARMRRSTEQDGDNGRGSALPSLVRAAFDNLRTAAAENIEADSANEAKIVDVLARAAMELRRK